jgi:3-hydroxybutyryl-CoA dehydrogenase
MGCSLALLCAQKGFMATNIDISRNQLDKAAKKVCRTLDMLVEKNKLNFKDAANIKSRITFSDDYADIYGSQIVIETVTEDIHIKALTIKKIEEASYDDTLILSNTSGLSITKIAEHAKRPQNVIGAHFFNPPAVLKLVEIIKGELTSDETFTTTQKFMLLLDRVIVTAPDTYGFIVNRLLIPMINEAAYLLMEGSAPDDIDDSMRSGANHPMGPLELGDHIGLDVVLAVIKGLRSAYPNNMNMPCPLIEQLVEKGSFGRKTGSGFYQYDKEGKKL